MKVLIMVGHSVLKNGNITSANGLISEYLYCKNLGKLLKKEINKTQRNSADLFIIKESKINKVNEERVEKASYLKNKNYDLIIELHLNASINKSANGVECYYYPNSSKGKTYSQKIVNSLGKYFKIRGIQEKNNLYILKLHKAPTILLETFFCTNIEDVDIGINRIQDIAKSIANSL